MKRHLSYLKYILRHKWFVLLASLRVHVPLWQVFVHDLSKFRPSEWGPYARCFYEPDGSKCYHESEEFALAWRLHQIRNPHHWQYWLLRWDRGETTALRMPAKYIAEMLADWMGAGRAITGKWETAAWYEKNKAKIELHPDSRIVLEEMLCRYCDYGENP